MLMRIRLRIRIRLHHPNAVPDSNFLFDADPDTTFHTDADPDADLSFKKRQEPLKNAKIGSSSIPQFWLDICKLMQIWFRI
jgi:hypothetical protein